jgi:serine/threonine-protein kinase
LALIPGTRLGPYEITAQIGVGGMGEVWCATDTNLGRQVAIKILPDAFAHDPERLARFEREAKTLASLNHPNIAIIHGLEKADGMRALVMELVDGPTLTDRIAQGPTPIEQALPIAKQIADALEAAHEQGIVHRDLKPANIKVREDGTVKVLDFGLAKAIATDGSAAEGSQVPTQTRGGTRAGMILGTAAYMSPEQARGEVVDKRTDIWAFGCVLYEMLAGRQAFGAASVTEILSEVLKSEPDWQRLPTETPVGVRRLLRRCLAKDRKRRLTDIHDARLELDELLGDDDRDGRGADHGRNPDRLVGVAVMAPRRRVWLVGATAVVASAVIAGALVWVGTRASESAPPVSRLTLTLPATGSLTINGSLPDLAITPDGSRVVYVGNRGTQLFVRALDAFEPKAVFTGGLRGPFVSPDGQWIAVWDQLVMLKKVAIAGGPAVTLATLENPSSGATWTSDDAIVFADNGALGLQRVGAAGGPTTVLTRPDRARGEAAHILPERLPGGRAVLFTITAVTGGRDAAQVAVLDLETGIYKVVLRSGSHARYVPSGHLIYTAGGTLRAVPFDLGRLETRGTPVSVVPEVVTPRGGLAVNAVVADNGTMAYVSWPGVLDAIAPRRLVWVDRQGHEMPIPAPPGAYLYPRLSPDGRRIVVSAADQQWDLWLWDLAATTRTAWTRLTFDPALDLNPVWTPDGQRLLLSSTRNKSQNLYIQPADGTGSATRLSESANQQNPTAITPDGTRVIYQERTPTNARDLRLLTLGPSPRTDPLLETGFEERSGIVSPDGNWLAYESDSLGRFDIYVRPFPNVGDGQSQISPAGGVQPLWAPSGRELFYVSPDGALMSVPVEPRGSTWSGGTATKLLEARYYTGAGEYFVRQYDVSPDGQRFLMLKEGGTDGSAPPTLYVVQNWIQELRRLAPVAPR